MNKLFVILIAVLVISCATEINEESIVTKEVSKETNGILTNTEKAKIAVGQINTVTIDSLPIATSEKVNANVEVIEVPISTTD